MNPYEVLELSPGADADEIKAAYHRLAKQWHPDRYTGDQKVQAEERFRMLAEAFSQLRDVPRREEKIAAPPQEAPIAEPKDPSPAPAFKEKTAKEWLEEAQAAFSHRDFDRANGLAQYCLRIDGEKPEYYVLMAKALEASGGDKKAVVRAYESAVRLNPKDVDSILRLADIFKSLGMHARSAGLIERARNIAPGHKAFKGHDAKKAEPESQPQGMGEQFSALINKVKDGFTRMVRKG